MLTDIATIVGFTVMASCVISTAFFGFLMLTGHLHRRELDLPDWVYDRAIERLDEITNEHDSELIDARDRFACRRNGNGPA